MRHPTMAENGLPRMIEVHVSSSIFRITKSTSTYKSPTFIGTSSKILTGYFIEQSANCKEIVVGLISPNSNFSHRERGIKLTLDLDHAKHGLYAHSLLGRELKTAMIL